METVRVKRANVVLDISPDQKDYYLGQGFDVIDEQGNVTEGTRELSIDALNRKVIELQRVIEQKDAEIARLKSQSNSGNGRGRRRHEDE